MGVLHCNLSNIKVGDELYNNRNLTDCPLEEAISPQLIQPQYQT